MARKTYDLAFKREALRILVEDKRSIQEVATLLAVSKNTLRKWLRTYEPEHAQNTSDPTWGVSDPLEANKLLRAEVERLRMELDVFKKAIAIFSHHRT